MEGSRRRERWREGGRKGREGGEERMGQEMSHDGRENT